MEIIGYYALFAFSISITICIFYFWPLVLEAQAKQICNTFTKYPKASAIIYIFISAVIAPVLLLPLLSDSMAEKFQAGLAKEILKSDQ